MSRPAPAIGPELSPTPLIVTAVHLSRTFGEGEAAVDALVDVSAVFPIGGFTAIMGLRLGQVDADAPARGPRPADLGHRRRRRGQRLPADLTRAGRSRLRTARGLRITVTATFRDVLGATTTTTARGVLR